MTMEKKKKPVKITAVYGSPRRKGNTATLIKEAVRGALETGAEVDEIVLRDLNISPCLEIYGCKKDGRCIIKDDFHKTIERVLAADGIIIGAPIFFYTVPAVLKAFMDRCQSLWVKKYWIDKQAVKQSNYPRKCLFISVGATKGKKLFDGVLLTIKYFLDAIDTGLWKSLLYRGLDFEKDVQNHPDYLIESYEAGRELVRKIQRA